MTNQTRDCTVGCGIWYHPILIPILMLIPGLDPDSDIDPDPDPDPDLHHPVIPIQSSIP
jgi:hypothetical protein